ncbi:MAG TPA: hypothetical protein VGS41_12355, partial [Chthonomonadales bacterium]|nr:hypothetical protein [Chthonomonadales bacterium]
SAPIGASSVAPIFTLDSSGSIFVACSIVSISGNYYSDVLLKYSAAGALQWQRSLMSTSTIYRYPPTGLAVDTAGNVIMVSGHSPSAFSGPVQSILKFSPSGQLMWGRTFPDIVEGGSVSTGVVATDSNDNVITTCTFYGSNQVAVTQKYDAAGNLLWTGRVPDMFVSPYIAVDPAGDIYTLCVAPGLPNVSTGCLLKFRP